MSDIPKTDKYFSTEVMESGDSYSYQDLLEAIEKARLFMSINMVMEYTFDNEYEGGLSCCGSRKETDKEYEQRIEAMAEQRRIASEREFENYKRLKAKFETDPVSLP